jgi:hypothetical protein
MTSSASKLKTTWGAEEIKRHLVQNGGIGFMFHETDWETLAFAYDNLSITPAFRTTGHAATVATIWQQVESLGVLFDFAPSSLSYAIIGAAGSIGANAARWTGHCRPNCDRR